MAGEAPVLPCESWQVRHAAFHHAVNTQDKVALLKSVRQQAVGLVFFFGLQFFGMKNCQLRYVFFLLMHVPLSFAESRFWQVRVQQPLETSGVESRRLKHLPEPIWKLTISGAFT